MPTGDKYDRSHGTREAYDIAKYHSLLSRMYVMTTGSHTCACGRVHGCISKGETRVISQMKSIFSPCASAPFYMSQDRIHLSNVTVLQLLEFMILRRMSRIFALFQASLMLAANLNASILGQH